MEWIRKRILSSVVFEESHFDGYYLGQIAVIGIQKGDGQQAEFLEEMRYISDTQNEFEYNGLKTTVEVKHNISFGYVIDATAQDWIRLVETKSMSTTELEFSILENESVDKREGKITIVSGDIFETERQGVITFTAGELKQAVTVIQSGVMNRNILTVTHVNTEFTVPEIGGRNLGEATVDWGDGSSSQYSKDANHKYEAAGTYNVKIVCYDAEDVVLNNIVGVTKIDLSDF